MLKHPLTKYGHSYISWKQGTAVFSLFVTYPKYTSMKVAHGLELCYLNSKEKDLGENLPDKGKGKAFLPLRLCRNFNRLKMEVVLLFFVLQLELKYILSNKV